MNYKVIRLNRLETYGFSKTKIKKLIKTFKCQINNDVEIFLHHKALLFEELGRSRTYIFWDIENNKVAGYFSIAMSVIDIKDLDPQFIETLAGQKLKNINDFDLPCYLIGQLGKSDEYKNLEGVIILKKAIQILNVIHEILNGRFILLDSINDKKVIKFYEENGFKLIENPKKESVKMVYPLINRCYAY